MLNFQFYNPTNIIFGKDSIKKLSHLIPKNSKVLILYGGSSAIKNGTIDEVREQLSSFECFEFGGIEPNPRFETLIKSIKLIKENKIDFLLAVGGGSVIDGTKFIAQAALYPDDPWNILTRNGPRVTEALPLGTVLTLPATGSEMNNRGVITRATTQEKLSLRSDLIFPKFSILDPTKTYSLPKNQLENGLVDSFVHVIEQYMTYPVDAKIPDYFSEGVLKTIIEIAPDVINKENDYNSRANFMWAATVALNGFLATGVPEDWSTHKIGHELTALYNLDHAKTLAMILPVLWKIKKSEKEDKLLQYAERVWDIKFGTKEDKIDLAIQKTIDFFTQLGMRPKLSDYGINKEADLILEKLTSHGLTELGERKSINLDIVKEILKQI